MTCTRYKELISRYVDGEVTPRQRRDILEHVEHCHDCAAWLARARQAEVLLKGVPDTRPSDRVRDAVLGAASSLKATHGNSVPASSLHLPMGGGLRLYAASLLLRYDALPQRIALMFAIALCSMVGLAYWLNILPPIWGYSQFGFTFPYEQEQAAVTNTPLPAISSQGQMSVPNLLRVSPTDGAQEVGLDASIRFGFDLPMDRASVEDAIQIDPPVAGSFKWNYDNEVSFVPADRGLLRDVTYTVSLSDTARSLAGRSTGDALSSSSFHTHRAYSVAPVDTPGSSFPITGSLKLVFEVPMDTSRATRDVSLRAETSGENLLASYAWDSTAKELTVIPLAPLPLGVISLRVGSDTTTQSGDTLGRATEFTYNVALPDNSTKLAGGRLLISPVRRAVSLDYQLGAGDGGVAPSHSAEFKVYDLPGEQLSALGAQGRGWPSPLPSGFPGNLSLSTRLSVRHVTDAKNPEANRTELAGRSPGMYLITASTLDPTNALSDWQMLVLTNRNITALSGIGEGKAGTFWVTDEAGKPWQGSEVSLYSASGMLLEKGLSDAYGLWTPAFAESSSATLAISRDPQGNLAAMILPPGHQQVPSSSGSGTLAASLQTDQPAYFPGEGVNFRATVFSRPLTASLTEPGVSVNLLNPQGSPVSSLSLKPDSVGGVTGLFSLASALQPAQYTLRVGFGSEWRDFPLMVVAPSTENLSLLAVPLRNEESVLSVLTYTVSVLGPTGEAASGSGITATLRISGDSWVSAPVFGSTDADGRATIAMPLPSWMTLYKDPDIYLDAQATWDGKTGRSQVPVELVTPSSLISGELDLSLVSPSLNFAVITEPQQDGSNILKVTTLSVDAQATNGDVLVQADSPSGERQFWLVDLEAAGGASALMLPSVYRGGVVLFMRAGTPGIRRLVLPAAPDPNLSLSVDAPLTTASGIPVPVTLKLTGSNGAGAESVVSIWFRRVADEAKPTERGWEPSAHVDASGLLTTSVTAPVAPGLWYAFVEAATLEGAYALSRTMIRVLPGPTIQLPPQQQLEANSAHSLAVSIYNPLDTPLSSGVRAEGDGSLQIVGGSSQGIEVPAGGWGRLQWNILARQPGGSTLSFSFLPSANAAGTWEQRVMADANPRTASNYASGTLSGERRIGVLVPSGLPDESVQLEIRASTSLLSALADVAGDLSVEQRAVDTSSWAARLSARPSVASAYKRAGSSVPPQFVASALERSLALQQLYSTQHADGSWGASLDPANGPGDPDTTSDVLLALLRQGLALTEAGREPDPPIDSGVIAPALAYLSWYSNKPVSSDTTTAALDSQARGLATLSLYGAARSDTLRPMMIYAAPGIKGPRLSRVGIAWLALGLWQTDDTADALVLVDRLLRSAPLSEAEKSLAAAPLLEVLVAASDGGSQRSGENALNTSQHKAEAREYARILMETRQGARWSSPSASADALWALSRYAAQEPDTSAISVPQSITLNDKSVLASPQRHNANTYTVTLSGDALHAGTNWLRLQASPNQPLYYSLMLRATR